LAIPELGSKQICPACQAKFYDLNKRPAHCPKCQTEFDPDEAVRSRRTRVRAVAPEMDDEREDHEDAEAGVAAPADDLAGFSEDEEGLEDDSDDVPFLEDDDEDDFDDSEIEGLPDADDEH
jgi:uncharacterized protein (TIGR02300 family)